MHAQAHAYTHSSASPWGEHYGAFLLFSKILDKPRPRGVLHESCTFHKFNVMRERGWTQTRGRTTEPTGAP